MNTAGSPPVPVTVGILTYESSAATVSETLKSVNQFAEVLICDGGSTDGTRELAAALGCTVIDQSPEFIDDAGRLINEAGVNEQVLAEASHDWVFFLDHDELATPELVEEIRMVIDGHQHFGAYQIPRLYVLNGEIIEHASMYPSYQIRLVNRNAIHGYGGIIHSPVIMKDDEVVGTLECHQLIPLAPLREVWPKWRGYMRLEASQNSALNFVQWRRSVLSPRLRLVKRIGWMTFKIRREHSDRLMPLRYELGRIAYELGVILHTSRHLVGLGHFRSGDAWR
jgi:glycosyltransferase involved in cell wall biosynthesis